jgi:hypothetical protein
MLSENFLCHAIFVSSLRGGSEDGNKTELFIIGNCSEILMEEKVLVSWVCLWEDRREKRAEGSF